MSNFSNLLGLEYDAGMQDCLTCVRDYYRQVWDVWVPNLARPSEFWKDPNLDLYGRYYQEFGFQQIFDVKYQIGDLLLMPLRTRFATHAGVLAEDNKILHHLPGRLSSLDDFRPHWSSKVIIVARHPEVTKKLQRNKQKPKLLQEVTNASVLKDPRVEAELKRLVE